MEFTATSATWSVAPRDTETQSTDDNNSTVSESVSSYAHETTTTTTSPRQTDVDRVADDDRQHQTSAEISQTNVTLIDVTSCDYNISDCHFIMDVYDDDDDGMDISNRASETHVNTSSWNTSITDSLSISTKGESSTIPKVVLSANVSTPENDETSTSSVIWTNTGQTVTTDGIVDEPSTRSSFDSMKPPENRKLNILLQSLLSSSSSVVLLTFQTNCSSSLTATPSPQRYYSNVTSDITDNSRQSFEYSVIEAVSLRFGVRPNQLSIVRDVVNDDAYRCANTLHILLTGSAPDKRWPAFDESALNRSASFSVNTTKDNDIVAFTLLSADLIRNDAVRSAVAPSSTTLTGSQLNRLFSGVSSVFLIVVFAIVGSLAVCAGAMSAVAYAYFRRKFYRKFDVRRRTVNRRRSSGINASANRAVRLHDVITLSPSDLMFRQDSIVKPGGIPPMRAFSIVGNDGDEMHAKQTGSGNLARKGYDQADDVNSWSLSRSASITRCLQTFSRLPDVSVDVDFDERQQCRKPPISMSTIGLDLLGPSNSSSWLNGGACQKQWKANPVFDGGGEQMPAAAVWSSASQSSGAPMGPEATASQPAAVRERVTPF
jgi:hypothetical protein